MSITAAPHAVRGERTTVGALNSIAARATPVVRLTLVRHAEATVRDLVDRLLRHLPGVVVESTPSPYPAQTIELQQRLARLSAEINALDQLPAHEFAEGHHERAARLAYQQSLDEACQLLGLPVEEAGPTHRLMAEARLMHAGWRW